MNYLPLIAIFLIGMCTAGLIISILDYKTYRPKMKYYLISYHASYKSNQHGYGNMFFEASPELDIRKAEKQVAETINAKNVVVLTINKVSKNQYVAKSK